MIVLCAVFSACVSLLLRLAKSPIPAERWKTKPYVCVCNGNPLRAFSLAHFRSRLRCCCGPYDRASVVVAGTTTLCGQVFAWRIRRRALRMRCARFSVILWWLAFGCGVRRTLTRFSFFASPVVARARVSRRSETIDSVCARCATTDGRNDTRATSLRRIVGGFALVVCES